MSGVGAKQALSPLNSVLKNWVHYVESGKNGELSEKDKKLCIWETI